MADFTTWSTLRTAVLNDLSNGSVLTRSYGIEGRSRSFHSLTEVMEFIRFCDMQIAAEGGEKVSFAKFKRPD